MSSQTKRESLSKGDEVLVFFKATLQMPHPKKRKGRIVEVLRAGARVAFDGEKGEPLFPFNQIEIAPVERKKEPPKADPAFEPPRQKQQAPKPEPIVEHKRPHLELAPLPVAEIESQISTLRQMARDLLEPIRRRIDEIDTTCAVLQEERTLIDHEIDDLTRERGRMKGELNRLQSQFDPSHNAPQGPAKR